MPSPTKTSGRRTSRAAPRLAVFLSGTGRTLANLIERINAGSLRADIELVATSRECRGADIAREAGLRTRILTGALDEHDLERILLDHKIDLAILAGYLKLLPVPAAYADRILNIHPALLPPRGPEDFGGPGMYGDRVHRAVHRAHTDGLVSESGCTVHLVTDQYDRGPVLLQRHCPLDPGVTPQEIADRVFALEKDAYPEAIAAHWKTLEGTHAPYA